MCLNICTASSSRCSQSCTAWSILNKRVSYLHVFCLSIDECYPTIREHFNSEGYACVQSMQKKRETWRSPNFNMPAEWEVHHCGSSCILWRCQKRTHCSVVLSAGENQHSYLYCLLSGLPVCFFLNGGSHDNFIFLNCFSLLIRSWFCL